MNKRSIVVVLSLLVLVLCGQSCAVLSGIGGSSLNPLASIQEKAEKRVNAEISSGVGLTGMTRKVMFNTIYAQVFFMGGFGPGFYQLEEGQGAAWKLTSYKEGEKPSSIETERALLKKNPDGSSWWLLSWKASSAEEGNEWSFEALMDKNMQAKKIRYYNADVQRVEEAVFAEQKAAKSDAEDAPPEASPTSGLKREDLAGLSKGKERLRVGGGSFDTEKLVWELIDPETKAVYGYTWWVDPKAPGGLVKFEWKGDKERLEGELSSFKKGYTTKLSSF